MRLQQGGGAACSQAMRGLGRTQQGGGGARPQQGRLFVCIPQHQPLQQEFQIHQTAFALLEVEHRGIAAVEFCTHPGTHQTHIFGKFSGIAGLRQHVIANLLEIGKQRCITGNAACAHQGLMFPRPGAMALVVGIAGQAGDQQALGTIRAQPHIHIEQTPRAGARTQQGHHFLPQARIPARRIQRTRAVGHRIDRRIKQEHQIQIRAKAQLFTPQGAIAQYRKPATSNDPMRRAQLGIGQLQHARHHRIGQPRQALRTLGSVDARIQQGKRKAETQGLPQLIKCIQRRLHIVLAQHRHTLRAHAGAIRQFTAHTHIQ